MSEEPLERLHKRALEETSKALAKAPKTPFAVAAANLAVLCDAIEELPGEDIPGFVIKMFESDKLAIRDAIDRRIATLRMFESGAANAGEARKLWQNRERALQNAYEALKSYTKTTMQENPGIPYQGNDGQLAIQKNSKGILNIDLLLKDVSSSLKRIDLASFDDAAKFPGLEKYMKNVLCLDTAELRRDLEEKTTLPWARLEFGSHVRIRV